MQYIWRLWYRLGIFVYALPISNQIIKQNEGDKIQCRVGKTTDLLGSILSAVGCKHRGQHSPGGVNCCVRWHGSTGHARLEHVRAPRTHRHDKQGSSGIRTSLPSPTRWPLMTHSENIEKCFSFKIKTQNVHTLTIRNQFITSKINKTKRIQFDCFLIV